MEVLFYIIEYMLPQVYLDDYVNGEWMEYELHFLPAAGSIRLNLGSERGASAVSVLSYRLPLFIYGGVTGSSHLQARLLLEYAIEGPLPPGAFLLTVNYYLGDRLVCSHEISYAEAVEGFTAEWCNFTLDAEGLVNGLYAQWPGVYVTVVARAAGPPGSPGVSLEVAVKSLVESSVRVRRLNNYSIDGVSTLTSMVPSGSPLWRSIMYVYYAATYTIVYQAPSQANLLGISSLTLVFDLYRETPTVCTKGLVGMSSDHSLIYTETSQSGSYVIEYSGAVYRFRTNDVDLKHLVFEVEPRDGIALEAYRPAYTLTAKLARCHALNFTGVPGMLGSMLGEALDSFRFTAWTLKYSMSQLKVYPNARASGKEAVFIYEAGDLSDLAWTLLEPHYHAGIHGWMPCVQHGVEPQSHFPRQRVGRDQPGRLGSHR